MYYSLVGIGALITILFLNYEPLFYKHYPSRDPRALNAYRIFILSACLFLISDIIWGFLYENQQIEAASVVTSIYFICMSLFVFSWTRFVVKYLDAHKLFNRILLGVGLAVAIAGIALVIVNLFVPVLFTYEATTYNVALGRNIYLGCQFLMFVFAFIYTNTFFIRSEMKRGRQQFISVAAFSLMMISATVIQFFFSLYPFYAAGIGLGLTLIHAFVVLREKDMFRKEIKEGRAREQEQIEEISTTKQLAYTDPLTGVKNKHAYVEFEEHFDELIREGKLEEFALFIFDLNDLKIINDNFGHEMGDKYIIKSVEYIKQYFPNVEIYRFGGDEFIIIFQDEDYKKRFECLESFNKQVEENIINKDPVIAVGFSDFVKEKDNTLRSVFLRADERMYSRKRRLKEITNENNPENVNKNKVQSNNNLRLEMYEMYHRNQNFSLLDFLNGSSADEILEIDIENDTFKQYYHVQGKYFVPNVGLSYKELLDFTTRYIVHPDDRGAYLSLMKIDGFFERLSNAHIPNFDFAHFRYKLQDGQYRYVEQVVIAGEENGIPKGMFRMYVFDIQNLKSHQLGKVSNDSTVVSLGRDTITGLLTSKDFFSTADNIVKDNPEKKWCLIAIDIEHFKFFDEWFGREKGDYLLAKIGAELKDNCQNNGGVAGYFGQDDFTVLVPFDLAKINELFENLKSIINSFGMSAGFLPAFGVAKVEKDMLLVDAFDRATIASTRAKRDIKNRISVFTYEMQFKAQQEYRILTDFIHALQNGEITFYLQPQCNLKTGSIVGAEALARWVKPDGALVAPNDFIPVLEQYGFITDLDKYIWEAVCKSLKKWIDQGKESVPVSLNVSRIDIFNIDIARFIHDICEKYSIPHKLVKIEITESAYAEVSSTIDRLVQVLRKDGFAVLMDDFGSGYSSLNMLSNLKLDAIKLDANFLHLDKGEDRGMHIIESVVNMAHNMALPIIVEGIETKQQREFLQELGCQYAQGYFFYRPMPVSDFEKIMNDKEKYDTRGFIVKTNQQFRVREFLDKNIYSDSMLNNIIGAVAIYAWKGEHIDIVRYNQQFFESVDLPDFVERLENIEQFLPKEDHPIMFDALKEAVDNRLTGSTRILRFYRSDGTLSSFRIHFYYIGKKEGYERFYGSATNVTELADLQDSKSLVAKYSNDNMIFIKKVYDKWVYLVISHGLSDVLDLSPSELEIELNNGQFAKRILNQKELKAFMTQSEMFYNKNMDFTQQFEIYDNHHNKVMIHLSFSCVKGQSNNIDYILRTKIVDKTN